MSDSDTDAYSEVPRRKNLPLNLRATANRSCLQIL